MDKNGVQYSSSDPRVGVDVDGLIEYTEVLEALMTLDNRGGYYDHLDMSAALQQLLTSKKHVAQTRKISRSSGIPFESLPELFAVKLRAMCSHVRIKFKDRQSVI